MMVIFGTGYWADWLVFYENKLDIRYFIDNDPSKQQNQFYGYDVKSPDVMADNKYNDVVVISSQKYAQEMKAQLLSLGVDSNQIINAWELEIFSKNETNIDFTEADSPIFNIKIRNRKDYEELKLDHQLMEMENVLSDMVLNSKRKRIYYPGNCQVCRRKVEFRIDNLYSENPAKVNFRERLVCPICLLCNRQRAIVRFVLDRITKENVVYLTEQVTPVYQALKKRHENLIGSEYLGLNVAGGTVNNKGIRHEDLTSLSFDDKMFDCIVSNDVLEHVADVKTALQEIYRVLKQRGTFYATFPMNFLLEKTIKRAQMNDNGEIENILEPVYHGNPISEEGSLVFYDYGWDFISLVKRIGFSDSYFIPFYSVSYGNIGMNSLFIFVAQK